MAQEAGAEILLSGDYGHLSKIPLKQAPEKATLRPGEETSVYARVLSTLKLGKKKDSVLALHRFKIWWLRPTFCHPIPPETLLLLEQVEGSDLYRLVLPAVLPRENGTSFASSSVRGRMGSENERADLILCGNHNEAGLYVGIGRDPYSLIQEGAALAAQVWKTSPSEQCDFSNDNTCANSIGRANNVVLDKLGWCTWNAFYTDLDGPKVVQAVRSLQVDHRIPVRWAIIDDGWQDVASTDNADAVAGKVESVDGDQWSKRLQSYGEDPAKFQALSLKSTIHQLRHELELEAIWVWHALAGYWLGINPSSSSFASTSKLHYAHFPPGILENDASASLEPSIDV